MRTSTSGFIACGSIGLNIFFSCSSVIYNHNFYVTIEFIENDEPRNVATNVWENSEPRNVATRLQENGESRNVAADEKSSLQSSMLSNNL